MLNRKKMGVLELIGGMVLLAAGRKVEGLVIFGKGMYDLEKVYGEDHPELEPGIDNRWQNAVEFYEDTHKNKTNRLLHMIGIPFIVTGAAGLLTSKPYKKNWVLSTSSFIFGWALNIIGHSAYEKNRPAFADDPLSFVAGPAWDLKQLKNSKKNNDKN